MAYRSSINVRNINKSLSGLNKSLLRARDSARSVRTTITESTRDKRKSFSASISAFNKRRESARRKEREDIVEASSIKGAISRSTSVVANSTRGFLGRILDFLGTLLVGWALTNLPGIIKAAQNLIERMEKYFELLNNFRIGLQNFLISFGDMVGEVTAGLSRFDFLSIKKAVDRGMNRMGDAFIQMNNSIDSVVRMLKQDINKLLGLDLFDIPAPDGDDGDDGDDGGGGGADPGGGSAQLPDPKSAEMYRIAAALTTEGNSDQGYADMLQVVANRVASPGYGSNYTDVLGAPGQFQGVYTRGSAAFKSIRSLGEASAWSGQSQATLLKVISLLSDPKRQASAASFVGGALEFRGSPATVRAVNNDGDPSNNIQANADGIIPGSVWRGTNQDNQFLVDPSKDPMIGGPASLNLPKPQPQAPPAAIQQKAAGAPPAAKTPEEGQNIKYTPQEIEALKKANPDLDIESLLGSNVKNYSSQLAMALQNGRKQPKTNTLIFNNTVTQTKYVADPSSNGGGNIILFAGSVNSNRNKYLSTLG